MNKKIISKEERNKRISKYINIEYEQNKVINDMKEQ